MDSIAELAALLAELRARDRTLRAFGARAHRYASRRVSPGELADFEATLGVRLPPAYRAFLEEVGHGAGPYYGLWSPAQSWEELSAGAQDLTADGLPAPAPSRVFPLADPGPAVGRLAARHPGDGAIPVAHHGCTFWTLLVTAGPQAGEMWDVACYVGFDGEFLPALRPPGVIEAGTPPPAPLPALASPPTFSEWYRGWLERSLADLGG